jgi:signal transduction histidine kinase
LDAVGWVLVLLACVALVWRRRWPTAVFAVVAVAVVAYLAGRYPYGPIFLVLSFTMYGVAVRVSARRAGFLCLITFVAVVGTIFTVEAPVPPEDVVAYLGGWACSLVVPLLVGVIVRLRRRSLAEVVARRAYEERLVLAREVHDVVAHGLAVISMQSGGALHVFDSDPERAREALAAIRTTSRDALGELRSALSVLREGASLQQLDDLVRRLADSGLVVTVHRTRPQPLPEAVDAAAYRIVQESLTNVLRHARTGAAAVHLEYDVHGVIIEVVDGGGETPGPEGHGIVGMRERAALVGGTLTAGPRPEGGFAVRAVLPVDAGEGS